MSKPSKYYPEIETFAYVYVSAQIDHSLDRLIRSNNLTLDTDSQLKLYLQENNIRHVVLYEPYDITRPIEKSVAQLLSDQSLIEESISVEDAKIFTLK